LKKFLNSNDSNYQMPLESSDGSMSFWAALLLLLLLARRRRGRRLEDEVDHHVRSTIASAPAMSKPAMHPTIARKVNVT
jgi:MYXO-CTERM domain-containing protein